MASRAWSINCPTELMRVQRRFSVVIFRRLGQHFTGFAQPNDAVNDHFVLVLQKLPARHFRHPKYIGFGVVVALFQFGINFRLIVGAVLAAKIGGVQVVFVLRVFKLADKLFAAAIKRIADVF